MADDKLSGNDSPEFLGLFFKLEDLICGRMLCRFFDLYSWEKQSLLSELDLLILLIGGKMAYTYPDRG